ncbi:DUF6894 family protein [Tardiphaga sp.]|jgi:hypothetical protein|uniref:DUF6894 family protein n=1 Tax=Tardiphaga sp. TaxID=1926292 RepID=UPI0037D9C3EC
MPQFFLNIEYDDGSTCDDADGGMYENTDAAMSEARKGLKALICETIDIDRAVVATSIHVVDDGGIERGVVSIGAVVPDCLKAALKAE